VLEAQLREKTRELATARDSLQREQTYVKRLERSLECSICGGERWDTVTGCGHLFGAECIKQCMNSAWVKDDEEYLVWEPRCPVCRVSISEEDLKQVYV
jgi:hypothetical protein